MTTTERKIKRIAVFTSGGDAPGMNAANRAVIRKESFYDVYVCSIYKGVRALFAGRISVAVGI